MGECYDRALLPSIICLGRFRIVSKYIFNLWQLRQGVDSLAQWLEHWIFIRENWVRFPRKAEYFFSYASFLCYGFHVIRCEIMYLMIWVQSEDSHKPAHWSSPMRVFAVIPKKTGINSRLSLSRNPRDTLKYFEISTPGCIRFAELRNK